MRSRIQILVLVAGVLATNSVLADGQRVQAKADKPSHAKKARHVPSPNLRSHIALIFDEETQRPLYDKNAEMVAPIASITKLMTAMVVLDADLPMDEEVVVEDDKLGKIRRARSKLPFGLTLTRGELLKLALMASENRAASALARSYPGGTVALVAAMNAKARELGMTNTRFVGPTGLDSGNVSTARDLVKMISAARRYGAIRYYSTSESHSIEDQRGRSLRFVNTNPLVKSNSWDIGLSKTGYIHESGLCLVMEANIEQRPVIIVLLNSWGKRTRVGDANRIKQWIERSGKRSI